MTVAARGYLPSRVPEQLEHCSQAGSVDDIKDVVKNLEIAFGYIEELGIGAFHFDLTHPERAISLVEQSRVPWQEGC